MFSPLHWLLRDTHDPNKKMAQHAHLCASYRVCTTWEDYRYPVRIEGLRKSLCESSSSPFYSHGDACTVHSSVIASGKISPAT